MKRFITLLLSVICLLTAKAQSVDERVGSMMTSSDWFELERELPTLKDSIQWPSIRLMAEALVAKGYKVVSGGTDNHCILLDLRTRFPELTGKVAEKALVEADITANKNMVPFDSRSPFQTSGIRLGTPAITTRGAKEDLMGEIVEMIDTVLSNCENEAVIKSVREKVNAIMADYPMFAY